MKLIYRAICLLGITVVLFSCKNEVKSDAPEQETVLAKKEVVTTPEKKNLSVEEKNQVNSVLMKAMVTPELKSFVSLMVSAGVTDMLAKNHGPFTIFAPSNDAIETMGTVEMNEYLNPENKASLEKLINAHIVKEDLGSTALVQHIKDANGSYELTTLAGNKVTVSREGTQIILTNATGVIATLGKTDIIGGNGVLHVMDKVLLTK